MAVLPFSSHTLVYGMDSVASLTNASPTCPTHSSLTSVPPIQDFEAIWRSALRSENPEEEDMCSIVDLQEAVNDFLHEGEDLSSSVV